MALFFVAVEERLGGLGLGIFWNELVDDEVFAVGTEKI